MAKRTNDDNYYGVMLENMNSKIDAILEIVIPMKEKVDQIPKMQEDIAELKADVKTIKAAVKATNKQHDRDIAELKAHLGLA